MKRLIVDLSLHQVCMASFTKPHLRHGPYDSQPFIRSFTAAASSTRWKGLSRHIPKGQRSSQEWRQCQWCMEKAIRKVVVSCNRMRRDLSPKSRRGYILGALFWRLQYLGDATLQAMSLKASSWLRNPCLASQQLLEYHTGE